MTANLLTKSETDSGISHKRKTDTKQKITAKFLIKVTTKLFPKMTAGVPVKMMVIDINIVRITDFVLTYGRF